MIFEAEWFAQNFLCVSRALFEVYENIMKMWFAGYCCTSQIGGNQHNKAIKALANILTRLTTAKRT